VEVQQQRELLPRCVLEVPHLAIEEGVVLRMDPAHSVVGDVHRSRRALPCLHLLASEPDLFRQHLVVAGPLGLEPANLRGGVAEVQPRHQVRVRIVVDDGRVLVRAGDAVDVEVALRVVEAEVLPEARGLDEDLAAHLGEEAGVAPHVEIAPMA
jgi:hypothetical protein